jgi:hypothetical protein
VSWTLEEQRPFLLQSEGFYCGTFTEDFLVLMKKAAPSLKSRRMTNSQHVYEVRLRKDKRGVDLISDALPFGGLWCGEPDTISNAVGSVKFYSRPALLAFPL